MKQMIALGDSVLKGVLYQNGSYKTCPTRFTDLLSKEHDLKIDNCGYFGCTVQKGLKILQKDWKKISSDIYDSALLSFGGNDSDFDWQSVSDAPEISHWCKTPLPLFKTLYASMIKELKLANKKVFLLSLPPIEAKQFFSFVSRGKNADKILQFLDYDIDYLMRWHEMYNLAVFALGAETQVPVLDITSAFLQENHCADYLCADGIHPNEKGHRLIADTLAGSLDELNRNAALPC